MSINEQIIHLKEDLLYKERLYSFNEKHQAIKSLKTYVKFLNIPEIIDKIVKGVSKTLVSSTMFVYNLLVAHCDDKTFLATVSLKTLSKECGFCEKWISKIIKELNRLEIIKTKRRGLGECNTYEFILHKSFLEDVKELERLYRERELAIINARKNKNNNNSSKKTNSNKNNAFKNKDKVDSFNNYEQRNYDFGALERKLLGWDEDEDSDTSVLYPPTCS